MKKLYCGTLTHKRDFDCSYYDGSSSVRTSKFITHRFYTNTLIISHLRPTESVRAALVSLHQDRLSLSRWPEWVLYSNWEPWAAAKYKVSHSEMFLQRWHLETVCKWAEQPVIIPAACAVFRKNKSNTLDSDTAVLYLREKPNETLSDARSHLSVVRFIIQHESVISFHYHHIDGFV